MNVTPVGERKLKKVALAPDTLARFSQAPATAVSQCRLLRRFDTKFVFPIGSLDSFLNLLPANYGMLSANGAPVASYRTLYFDTPTLRCFHDHRRGRRIRYKVRIRNYDDRALSFLELKLKQNKSLMTKHQLEKSFGDTRLQHRDFEFLRERGNISDVCLEEQVWVKYRRLTLVGLNSPERVTIDLNLSIHRLAIHEELTGLAIVEVKQPRISLRTPVMQVLLRSMNLQPMSISKYCTAVALTRSGIRLGRLIPNLRKIERIAK